VLPPFVVGFGSTREWPTHRTTSGAWKGGQDARGAHAAGSPLSDGVVTLRLPDVDRDAQTTIAISEDPEIQRWLLGGKPKPANPRTALEGQLEIADMATATVPDPEP
jgi:hypothetical protein